MTESSKEIQKYFREIEEKVEASYQVAEKARKKGYDPEDKVDIPRAKNIAERVTGLISVAYPPIAKTNVSKRIQELEKEYGNQNWRVALQIAEEVAKEKFCRFEDKVQAIEIGIRIGIAYVTNGVVASPLEGFSHLKIEKTKDGKDYFKIYYSGPIRSAGGTGASISVLIADYVRKKLDYAPYDSTEKEVKRYVTELYDYHERITNLQYLPSAEEIEFMTKNLPVQIAGDPSEKVEVSNHKDLERVETNTIRNGICLVIGEGLCQKAPKVWKQLAKWGKDFDMGQWNFLEEFIKLQKKIKAGGKEEKKEEKEDKDKPKISPDYTFIKDLVAGRPVLTHPLGHGGLRLRYGRSRVNGYSAASLHPATMAVLEDYIGIGTQLKMERPGKGCTITSCDSIEGPIVKMEDGSVRYLETLKQAEEARNKIKEVLFLGDMLINYGDFLNRAHVLVPPGYCEEWWVQEFEKKIVDTFGNLDLDKLSELISVPSEELELILKDPIKTHISSREAVLISRNLDMPLHPFYTYHWKALSKEDLVSLFTWMKNMDIKKQDNDIIKIIISDSEEKRFLEKIGMPHLLVNKEFVVIEKQEANLLSSLLDLDEKKDISPIIEKIKGSQEENALDILNKISSVMQRDKSGIFIGARMGRPEKAKMRKLTGSPQVLFPVGEEGGRLRCFQAALETGKINGEFAVFFCDKCQRETIFGACEICSQKTRKKYFCKTCNKLIDTPDCRDHGFADSYKNTNIDITHHFDHALKKLGSRTCPDLIKGVKGTSNKEHIPEHLIKGIVRAKHEIYVNKDGTTRYDMTQQPVTHFKPKEIGTSVEKLKSLGYEKDIRGKELEKDDQILELKPQDTILPACMESPEEGSDNILFRTANFCDEILEKMYGLDTFYNLKSPSDLVGHLGIALAPHTSAAIVVRIIGFSKTQGFLAHPMIHAATRRDCDGDEASISLLLDALLNFSRQYLPAHKGATQDAPLVLTSTVIPSEVDDMIFDMDTVWKYPLEFYNACLEYKMPWDVDIEKFEARLNTPGQFEKMGFTHDTSDFNTGVRCSSYKVLPSMEEKLKGQMKIAEKVRAVDIKDVARLVIEKHFIRDIKGNLRKFSTQQFRCVKCNEKYRRPPLVGKCTKCGGRIIFTISEGSVIKYLEPSISIVENYDVPPYLKQSVELVRRQIEDVFGKEKEKQEGLGKWFG